MRSLVLLSMVFLFVACQKQPTDGASQYPDFPSGFDWPADPQQLQTMIDKRDLSGLRRHAWYLWAGLNVSDSDGLPVWRDWPTTTQTYALPEGYQTELMSGSTIQRNVSHNPINLPGPYYAIPKAVTDIYPNVKTHADVKSGEVFQFNGNIMIVDVVYNQAAYDWIRGTHTGKRLYLVDQLNAEWSAGKRDINPAPAQSIVLKHMYWPVKQNSVTVLPVWDNQPWPDPDKYIGYELWNRAVAVDTRDIPKPGEFYELEYLYDVYTDKQMTKQLGPIKKLTRAVSVDRFYHQQVDQVMWDRLGDSDKIILHLTSWWTSRRLFEVGDYIVSIAMHINTKEIPQWTLQSVWWHDYPDQGRFAADRPDIPATRLAPQWRNYLLTTADGIEHTVDGRPQWAESYNPYIELGANHPIKTNCRNCHLRAAWPDEKSSYLAAGGPGPLDVIKVNDPVFDGLMRLDFQWALGPHAQAAEPEQD